MQFIFQFYVVLSKVKPLQVVLVQELNIFVLQLCFGITFFTFRIALLRLCGSYKRILSNVVL